MVNVPERVVEESSYILLKGLVLKFSSMYLLDRRIFGLVRLTQHVVIITRDPHGASSAIPPS
jgi:hypothetical protein